MGGASWQAAQQGRTVKTTEWSRTEITGTPRSIYKLVTLLLKLDSFDQPISWNSMLVIDSENLMAVLGRVTTAHLRPGWVNPKLVLGLGGCSRCSVPPDSHPARPSPRLCLPLLPPGSGGMYRTSSDSPASRGAWGRRCQSSAACR